MMYLRAGQQAIERQVKATGAETLWRFTNNEIDGLINEVMSRGLRYYFNQFPILLSKQMQQIRMELMMQELRHYLRGPALSSKSNWYEIGPFTFDVGQTSVSRNKYKDMYLRLSVRGNVAAWTGGPRGTDNYVFAHPNEMSLDMQLAVEVDLDATAGRTGGSCCLYDWTTPNSRLPGKQHRVVATQVYRRYRDTTIVADRWKVVDGTGRIVPLRAGLMCWNRNCPVYQVARCSEPDRHKPRAMKQ